VDENGVSTGGEHVAAEGDKQALLSVRTVDPSHSQALLHRRRCLCAYLPVYMSVEY